MADSSPITVRVLFCGAVIAATSQKEVRAIDWPPPTVERNQRVNRACESDEAAVQDMGGQLYTLTITVHREFDSFEAQRTFALNHIARISSYVGELKIFDGGQMFLMPTAMLTVGGTEAIGVSNTIVYTFKGGRLAPKDYR